MREVRAELESVLCSLLAGDAALDCPVLPGAADGVRPDRYVSVVALECDPRGSASLVTMEFRIVAPATPGSVTWIQETLRKVSDWAFSDSSPLNGYDGESLGIFGSAPPSQSSEVNATQRAEILSVQVGAIAR